MAKDFGATWWGKAWLNALTGIDSSSRLPRGARYARSGAVEKLKIEGCHIEAKVHGTHRYTVRLIVSSYKAEQIEKFIDELVKSPAIVTSLLNRNLDPAIVKIAERCKIWVFPTSWRSMLMFCTCPDWAVPCKHIAALIYALSREIDNNPFLVFTLHNIDLLEELKKRGVVGTSSATVEIPTLKEYISEQKKERRRMNKMDKKQGGSLPIDLSSIGYMSERITGILPEDAPFSGAGFKKKYEAELHDIQRSARQLQLEIEDAEKEPSFARDEDISAQPIDIELIKRLLLIPGDEVEKYSASVRQARQAAVVALHLTLSGAIVPHILRVTQKKYTIRWQAALADSNVREAVEPIALFLEMFISALTFNLSKPQPSDSKIFRMFFKGEDATFSSIGEKGIPGGIMSWLSCYSLNARRYLPVLIVNEAENEKFYMTISVEDAEHKDDGATPLRNFFTNEALADSRYNVLSALSHYKQWISGYNEYVDNGCTKPIVLTNNDMLKFLMDDALTLRTLGAKVMLPVSMKELIRPKISMSISASKEAYSSKESKLSMDNLLDFEWSVAIGSQTLTKEEFAKLDIRANELIHFKKNYIYITEEELMKLRRSLLEPNSMPSNNLLQAALSGAYGYAPVKLSEEAKNILRSIKESEAVPVPALINATLRPYQERGYSWMWNNLQIGFGCILADDMGLGKTLQVITLFQKMKDEGLLEKKKALVIVPTGLLVGWQSEVKRFAPALKVKLYYGAGRISLKEDFAEDIMLTSYGVMRSDAAMLGKLKWKVVVIDEAQNIKNPGTEQSKAARSIKADIRIALSGTPVENRLSEYWTIMDFADKGYLGSLKKFKEEYAVPIQRDGDRKALERFKLVTSPFIMRRLKTDRTIINDLPNKTEKDEYTALSPNQALLYKKIVEESLKAISGIEGKDSRQLFKRQGLVLQMILALKQICNHPAEFLKDGNIDASLSGKASMLLDLVESIDDAGEKVLIFTQFREMGEILASLIEERLKYKPMFLHGGCTLPKRKEMIERFQSNSNDRIFILSLKAAGTGLNLTAATHVIHYDLWWNPAVEAQATDRAYRIGQHKNVIVHRFITQNTFEEKINEMIAEKKELANLTVGVGESWVGNLSDDELQSIFNPS